MKKFFYTTCLTLISFIQVAKAQNVYIPDANFKAALVNNPAINTSNDNDGEIQLSEAGAYTGSIDVSNLGITDLTGIEAFTGITYLNCSYNSLDSLDISFNTALVNLICGDNSLMSLNVYQNTFLQFIQCDYNQLTSLDVSNNTALTRLFCVHNQLTSPYLVLNTALETLNCSYNQLTSLDVSQNRALSSLSCGSNQLTSLNILQLTALNDLECSSNQLTILDISDNFMLTYLSCGSNQLTSLDLSNHSALSELRCDYNQLSSLDVSNNTGLTNLTCYNNQLTSLDVSANSILTQLVCATNQLLSLNLKNGNNTNISYISATDNPSLTCIQVDDAAYMNTNWSAGKDAAASYSTNCGGCTAYTTSFGIASGSPSNICSGGSTNLAVTIANASASVAYFDVNYTDGLNHIGSRYFVSGPNTTITIPVTPSSSTTYTLENVFDASGCQAIIEDTFAIVTVFASPTVTTIPVATTNLCPGTTVKFTASVSPNYLWSNGKTTRSITVRTPGDYSVSTTQQQGCTNTSAATSVTYQVCGAPSSINVTNVGGTNAQVDFTGVACGQSYELRYKEKGSTLWTNINNITATPYTLNGLLPNTRYLLQMRTNCSITPVRNSGYSLTTRFNTTALLMQNKIAGSEIQEGSSFNAIIYPNPAKSTVTLSINGNKAEVSVTITDLSGKTLWQALHVKDAQMKLPVEKFASGIYIISVNNAKEIKVLKLVKD